MQNHYWWNESFEDMMNDLGDWLQAHPHVTLVHTDWKYVKRADEDLGHWYMMIIYKH